MKLKGLYIAIFALLLAVGSYMVFVGNPLENVKPQGFPLTMGSSGSNVAKLQEKLNKKGFSLSVDGDFGPKTEKAVLAHFGKGEVTYKDLTLL